MRDGVSSDLTTFSFWPPLRGLPESSNEPKHAAGPDASQNVGMTNQDWLLARDDGRDKIVAFDVDRLPYAANAVVALAGSRELAVEDVAREARRRDQAVVQKRLVAELQAAARTGS